MLNTIRIREIYAEIQNQLFYLIPEKWSKICINVYEVPSKFNVNEKDYLVLVDKLYETIKKLRAEFNRNRTRIMDWFNNINRK